MLYNQVVFLNKIPTCIYSISSIDNGVLAYFLGNWWCSKIDPGVAIFVVCGVEGAVSDLPLVAGVITAGVSGFNINIHVSIYSFQKLHRKNPSLLAKGDERIVILG